MFTKIDTFQLFFFRVYIFHVMLFKELFVSVGVLLLIPYILFLIVQIETMKQSCQKYTSFSLKSPPKIYNLFNVVATGILRILIYLKIACLALEIE